jgi:hypothetical protein
LPALIAARGADSPVVRIHRDDPFEDLVCRRCRWARLQLEPMATTGSIPRERSL